MTDVTLVALITSSGTVLVAVASALVALFGPGRQERTRQRLAAEAAEEKRRYDRAAAFAEALILASSATTTGQTRAQLAVIWAQFASTLRSGDGPISEFAELTMEVVLNSSNRNVGLSMATLSGDTIFRWLRGDVSTEQVNEIARTLKPKIDSINPDRRIVVS